MASKVGTEISEEITKMINKIPYIIGMKIWPILHLIGKSVIENQVTFVSAGTGSGKTVAIPRMILELMNYGELVDYTLLVSIPTVMNVLLQYEFALKNNSHMMYEFARACSGKKTKNFHSAKIVFATTQTICNYIADLHTKNSVKLNKLIVMIDEAHHSSQENYVLHGICNWLIEKGIMLKIIISTATPSEHPFNHLKGIPITLSETQFPVKYHWNDRDDVMYDCINHCTKFDNDKLLISIQNKVKKVKEIVELVSGHILIFVSGEKNVETLCESLRILHPDCIVLPLYGSLPEEEITAVSHNYNKRKLIVATNVAECGITIPDIVAVIDSMLHKQMTNVRDTRVIKECVISQASSIQRAGRAGRTCVGHYFPIMTKAMYDQLPKFIDNEFMLLSKHIPVLNLLSNNFPPREVLMIPEVDYNVIIEELVSGGLVTLTLDSDKYIVTEFGAQVSKYPLSIKATSSILHAIKIFNVTEQDFRHRDQNFFKLLHFMIGVVVNETYASCPHIFDIPREYRKKRVEFIRDSCTYDDFKQDDDINVLITIFCKALIDNYDERRARKLLCKSWCREHNINVKFIESCYRLFNQLWNIIFTFNFNMLCTLDFEIIVENIDEYKNDMYKILALIYNDRVFRRDTSSSRLKYVSMTRSASYSVENTSIARMWNRHPSTIIALSETTIEIPGKRPFTIINICFPV